MSSHPPVPNGPPVYGPVSHRYGEAPPPTYTTPTYTTPTYPAQNSAAQNVAAQNSPAQARADWSRRAPGFLIDFAPGVLALIALTVAYVLFLVALLQAPVGTESTLPDLSGVLIWVIVGGVLLLVMLAWAVQNRWLTGGQTGQSLGRRVMKVRLLSEQTGEPVEATNAFARDLAHCLDLVALVGFLWPLWDARRQTFADMIMNTVVVDERGQERVS